MTIGASRWVLLVDDTGHDVELYSMHLHAAGFNVVSANSGQQGLDKARDWRPQIVIVDLMLPDISGWELCRQLKRDPKLGTVPIIVLTGRPEPEGLDRAREIGCAGYLTKPCLPDALLGEVVRVLDVAATPAER